MKNNAQSTPQPLVRTPDVTTAMTELKTPISRRNLLWKSAILSLAIPGMGALSACDKISGEAKGKEGDGVKGTPVSMEHGQGGMDGMDHAAEMAGIPAEVIAAASSSKFEWYDPALPPAPKDGVLNLHWTSQQTPLRIAENRVINAWTFNSNTPGPIAHCRVGDTVNFTLTNEDIMPHSMDFHAAVINPVTAFRSVFKDQSVSYTFKARRAGAFLYHCGTAPMLLHIGAGMFGALIVSPREPLPPAREFVLVQNEYYLGDAISGVYPIDYGKMMSVQPQIVAFNGRPDQYMHKAIHAKLGERVRFWVVNAGPTLPCAFHVVGLQFDTVYLGEPPGSAIHGVQTFNVAAGGGMVFDVVCDVPGEFPFVNHASGHGQKGAMGVLVVEA